MSKKRLAIINTHPIQYYAPLYRILNHRQQVELKVFFTQKKDHYLFDKGFGKEITWDIPLLEGYTYEFVSGRTKLPFYNQQLVQQIKAWKPDAILVTGWNFHGHLAVMRYFKGRIPVIFRGDSHLLNEEKGLKRIARRSVLTLVYRWIDKALFVGKNNREYFLAHQLQPEQLFWGPHAIDNDRFSDDKDKQYEKQAQLWRKELGLTNENMVFLYAGKLETVKNLTQLIRAFKNVAATHIRLLFVGNGPEETMLKELASKDHRILFIGFQNQSKMPVVYRLGDVFVLPSKSETWGLAINEAMACGRPVIVSEKVGCGPDLVSENYGRVFSVDNVRSLKEALESFLLPKEMIKKMGSEAKEAVKSWSFQKLAQSIENCLN